MAAVFAEDLDKQIGAAIDDFGVVFKIRGGIDHFSDTTTVISACYMQI